MLIPLLALLLTVPLPTGWRISPAGELIALDSYPVHAELLPDGQHALILQSGFRPPSLTLLHLASGKSLASFALADGAVDFAYDAAAGRAYVPTAHDSAVEVIDVQVERRELSRRQRIVLSWPGKEFPRSYASSLSLGPSYLAVTETMQNSVAIVERQSGQLQRRLAVLNPSRTLQHGGLLYVLGASPSLLYVFSGSDFSLRKTVPLSTHPASLVIADGLLYVAASGTNFVDVLDLADPADPKPLERINVAPTGKWPTGMTPAHLSYDAGSGRVYVTCSDGNTVAVLDRRRRVSAYIPTGWYPTATLPLPGAGLLVLNGKGERSYPNPQGPNPTLHRTMTPQPPSPIQYIPLQQTGSARLLKQLDEKALRRHSADYARLTPVLRPAGPGRLPKEIQNVIFIMKENRTYDQVLGDITQGNGDASLCLFPEKITPNHHKLARDFVLFDNFYVNADVSSEGWMWTSAAIVPRFVMQRWPAAYAGRNKAQRNSVVDDPLDDAPGGYLWTNALKAGLSFRNYGYFVSNRAGAKPGEAIVAGTADPALLPYTNPRYAGYDPGFPDVERARIFLEDLQRFEAEGKLPRLIVMVLPNDHTWGTAPGKLSPYASMADNDLALGQIVEGVSRSKFWPHTAIFVLEDDAQNGPDHVDSHRSPAFVISPYTRRGAVDHTFYNTTSMLATIERILKLPALTHYDASSIPMLSAFGAKGDLRPWQAEGARVPLDTLNPARSATAARSEQLDLSQPDRNGDAEMNEVLWLALRGTLPPPPTRAGFIRR
jgi:DNA-binding beta-propeller fold protein YncE